MSGLKWTGCSKGFPGPIFSSILCLSCEIKLPAYINILDVPIPPPPTFPKCRHTLERTVDMLCCFVCAFRKASLNLLSRFTKMWRKMTETPWFTCQELKSSMAHRRVQRRYWCPHLPLMLTSVPLCSIHPGTESTCCNSSLCKQKQIYRQHSRSTSDWGLKEGQCV